jgi:hypothetical protein
MQPGTLNIPRQNPRWPTTASVIALLVLGCSVATAALGIHQGGNVDRPGGSAPIVAAVPAGETTVAATDAPSPAKIRVIPLIDGIDPTPPARSKGGAVQEGAQQAVASSRPLASSPGTPTECLPQELHGVLQDVQARFGAVTLVTTAARQTDHHAHGSLRQKLHAECRAVDFKVAADLPAVMAYLRGRPAVAISVFPKSGVIHLESNNRRQVASNAGDQGAAERPRRRRAATPARAVQTAQAPGVHEGLPLAPSMAPPQQW